jgi:hypothetical protein
MESYVGLDVHSKRSVFDVHEAFQVISAGGAIERPATGPD